MSSAIVSLKETVERYRTGMARVREKARGMTTEVVGTVLAAATAAGIGAFDEAKGESRDHDEGITTANIGPLPASLVVAGLGKVAAVSMLGEETGRLASSIGQGAADAWSYVEGRRLWKRHEANKGK